MKWLFVFLNLAAAVTVVLAGAALLAIHHAHSHSVYSELVTREAILTTPQKVTPVLPEDPVDATGQYDIVKRLETIGGLNENLPIITFSAAALFLLNAVAFLVLWKRKSAPSTTPP